MKATEPLQIHHSWPLFEMKRHFDLGCVLSCAVTDMIQPGVVGELGLHHAGFWECDLSDNSIVWSGGVYDLFGLSRDADISRDDAVALYCEDSRTKMERLRTYAIRHRRGFTLDVEILPAMGGRRWMRLIGAPICEGNRAVRLHGMKLYI